MISRIFKLKFNKNLLTIIDIGFIVGIFFFLKMYYANFYKGSSSSVTDGIKIISSVNRVKIKQGEFLIINLALENEDNKEKIINLTKKNLFNYTINKDDILYYKNDITEYKRETPGYIRISARGKVKLSLIWENISNTGKNLKTGTYSVHLFSDQIEFSHKLSIEIVKGE